MSTGRPWLLMVLMAALLAGCAPERAPAPESVQLAYFYKPADPSVGVEDMAARADLMILTKKDEPYRDALRAAGYRGPVLQYVLAAEVYGPPGVLSAEDACVMGRSPWHNQVAYEDDAFCSLIHPHEDWFLHNGRGERIYVVIDGSWFYHMNPASPGWRQFFLDVAAGFLEGDGAAPALGYDGLFLDNVELSRERVRLQATNSDGALREFADDEAYREAWVSFLAEVSGRLRPRWPVWANMIASGNPPLAWEPYLAYLDGVMNESFATSWAGSRLSPERWEAALRQAEAVMALGKGYLGVAQGGDDDELQPFALASYLLVSDGRNGYFRYLRRDHWGRLEDHPNQAVRLGDPLGPRYQQADGTWRRDFRNGSVVVDPAARVAWIEAGP